MDPITIAALLGAGASILSGFLGSNAAQSASQTQAAAADKATALQAATIAQARQDAAPWLAAGQAALQQYTGELGLTNTVTSKDAAGNTVTKPFVSQFSATPNYQFDIQQGTKGIVNNLAALGLKQSGAAEKAIGSYLTGKANDTYQQYLDRLSGVSTGGQTVEGNTSALGVSSAANQANSIMNSGAATASGYVGSANALGAGLTGAAGNITSALGYKYPSYTTGWGL